MNDKNQTNLEQLKYEIADEIGIPHAIPGATNMPHANAYLAGSVGGLMTKQLVAMGEHLLMEDKKK